MPLVHDLARYRSWPDHAVELARLLDDAAEPTPATRARCERFLARFDPRRDALWTVMPAGRPQASLALVGLEQGPLRIEWLHVAPAWRGRGLARALWQRALHFAGGRDLEVQLPPEDGTALALAASAGFVPATPRGSPSRPWWTRHASVPARMRALFEERCKAQAPTPVSDAAAPGSKSFPSNGAHLHVGPRG